MHYGVNTLSSALAERVLSDPAFSARLVTDTIAMRDRLAAQLRERGLAPLPSATNFLAIRYPSPEEAAARQKVLLALSLSPLSLFVSLTLAREGGRAAEGGRGEGRAK